MNTGTTVDTTYSGLITLGSNSTISSPNKKLTLSNTGQITGDGFTLTFSGWGEIAGVIATGSGGLTKTSALDLKLSGLNTYTGPTTISGGSLSVSVLADGGVASGIGQSSNAASNLKERPLKNQ